MPPFRQQSYDILLRFASIRGENFLITLSDYLFHPFSKTFGIRFPERLERSSKAMQRYKKSAQPANS